MLTILGYSLALVMGLSLGLIGAGGSILAVPILVYLFHVEPVTATSYSLFIVGFSALMGALSYWLRQQVHFKKALTFALPSMMTVWLTRSWLIPTIPPIIFGLTKDTFIMTCFAFLMIISAIAMFRYQEELRQDQASRSQLICLCRLLIGSISVGFLTGLLGAGGGFLLIPALIALFDFSIREAVGTSLTIIFINACAGLLGDIGLGLEMNWHLLCLFLLLTTGGVILGFVLSKKIRAKKIKNTFAVLCLLLGLVILLHEL